MEVLTEVYTTKKNIIICIDDDDVISNNNNDIFYQTTGKPSQFVFKNDDFKLKKNCIKKTLLSKDEQRRCPLCRPS